MKEFTIIGSTGLVGKEIKKRLTQKNIGFTEANRKNASQMLETKHNKVIYCAGENKCDNENLANLVQSNVKLLSDLIQKQNFEHLVYFSSTRIYLDMPKTSEELPISFDLEDSRAVFNSSKLFGEAICKLSTKPVCIVRPSNIYGHTITSNLFLPSICRDALNNGVINMFVDKTYSKDYISSSIIAELTLKLAEKSFEGCVNLASGVNTDALSIAEKLKELTNCKVVWHPDKSSDTFTPIETKKLQIIFPDYSPPSVLEDLAVLINDFVKMKTND